MNEPLLVGGRYQLGEVIGRGGMAEVRRGTDTRLGRTVAIKRLRTDLASDPSLLARFRREAQASAGLNHRNIVAVYDTGEELSTDGTAVPQPYIVMEYVPGRTLREILRDERRVLPQRASEIIRDVLDALEYSHQAGVIHRDIKPGNIMLTATGEVKVMDFGIARATAAGNHTMTQTAAVVGTAQYLSPEQARGETVDGRSDIYSAGCLLYELLIGKPPFQGDSAVAVAYQHVREVAPSPSQIDPNLPPQLDSIVMKALAKAPSDRYQSAALMRNDLVRYLAGHPVEAPKPAIPSKLSTEADPITQTIPAATNLVAPPKKKRGGLLAFALLGLVAIVAAAFWLPKFLNPAPKQVSVPDLAGMDLVQARNALADRNLIMAMPVTKTSSTSVPAGEIISTDPNANSLVTEKTEIQITVSTGKPDVKLPSGLIGQSKESVLEILKKNQLRGVLVEKESDEKFGVVIEIDPTEGTEVGNNSKVTVYYSDGWETVPKVVGMKFGQAEKALIAAGFKVNPVKQESTQPPGTVIQQSNQGVALPAGTLITLNVAMAAPTPTPTPTVTPTVTPTPTP